ncbi:hypothetical protein DPMN_059178 [Dreissena polymorpha]|uniref:Uncharacterized protein n=1 Tax=Dreissena polymorpha TaxID=45954 RepID=A0A9D4C3D7_DREPO|nr:hypothetical protein DPMN_059178 [Dreissena polymorpha]
MITRLYFKHQIYSVFTYKIIITTRLYVSNSIPVRMEPTKKPDDVAVNSHEAVSRFLPTINRRSENVGPNRASTQP